MSGRTPSQQATLTSYREARRREAAYWRAHRRRSVLRALGFVACLAALAVVGVGLGYQLAMAAVYPPEVPHAP